MLVAVVVFSGCPYTSKVPISDATEKINPELFGQWVKKSDMDSDNPDYLDIHKVAGEEQFYLVKEYDWVTDNYTIKEYHTHTTTINGHIFLNMQENGRGDYYLHRVDINDDDTEITLYEVTDNIDEEFSDTKSLYDYVKENMELSFFYNKDEKVYIRGGD